MHWKELIKNYLKIAGQLQLGKATVTGWGKLLMCRKSIHSHYFKVS